MEPLTKKPKLDNWTRKSKLPLEPPPKPLPAPNYWFTYPINSDLTSKCPITGIRYGANDNALGRNWSCRLRHEGEILCPCKDCFPVYLDLITHFQSICRMLLARKRYLTGKLKKYARALTTYRNDNGDPPLNAALRAKDEDAAEALLDGGDDPNEIDGNGMNALHTTAWYGCRLPLFHRILGMIHNVNAGFSNGMSALMLAVRQNHLDMVVSLMNHPGIEVNVKSHNCKHTALHWAVRNNRPAIVAQLLSDSRIDTSLKDSDKRTPLMLAIEMGRDECVKILREHGAPEE